MANIVIAFPKMEDAIGIKNLLVRNGYPVTAVCTSGANVLSTIAVSYTHLTLPTT